MENKRRITFYTDMNGPHEDQVRENARRTPEECWEVYLRMKRRHYGIFGKPEKPAKRLRIEKPEWI